MIEGWIPKEDVVDLLLDLKLAMQKADMEAPYDVFTMTDEVNQFIDNALKEI